MKRSNCRNCYYHDCDQQEKTLKFTGIGGMSGSSLDGLDLACVEFTGDFVADKWSYLVLHSETIPYDLEWRSRLTHAHSSSAEQLAHLHIEYGKYLGQQIQQFIQRIPKTLTGVTVDYIATHGHTIFHQPERRFTFQVGDGETLACHVTVPVVTNFRCKDLALGGQGAPLAPYGEKFLFKQYDICLNLGGISNITFDGLAYDISPCNMLLNYLVTKHRPDLLFDEDGKMASTGKVNQDFLDQLNALIFYKMHPPKSLGREWFDQQILPILETQTIPPEDLLRTAIEHIAQQIVNAIACQIADRSDQTTAAPLQMMATGGGALNLFLVQKLREKLSKEAPRVQLMTVNEETIGYKEAIIFAFLGLRALLGLKNVGGQLTGSSHETVSGSIHIPLNYNCKGPILLA